MKTQEAIKELEWLKKSPARSITIWNKFTIDAFDESIRVLRKQIPMKPRETALQKRCPACGRRLPTREKTNSLAQFCGRCGQAIDWSDSK